MQLTRPKIIFLLISFMLSVTPQAFLLEQVIAQVAEWPPHIYQDTETHEHEKPTPSRKHPDEEHQAEFCCDNSLNLYIGSQYFTGQVSFEQHLSPLLKAINVKTTVYSNPRFYFQNFRLPISFRVRDKYALSCLLHAPPRA
ncbi:MAG: hypothetical protein ACE5IW_06905 [bacterium]